ncbi:hypothetical protein N9L68_05535, partial [bacterium]|nr:hypothetical protein [bacterium]
CATSRESGGNGSMSIRIDSGSDAQRKTMKVQGSNVFAIRPVPSDQANEYVDVIGHFISCMVKDARVEFDMRQNKQDANVERAWHKKGQLESQQTHRHERLQASRSSHRTMVLKVPEKLSDK